MKLPAPELGLSLLLAGGAAHAHGIQTNLSWSEGLKQPLSLESAFSSGEPAAAAQVRLVAPGGESIAVGQTDAQGRLSFALPKGASGTWEVQVDGGPGHRDYLEMPVRAGRADLQHISESKRPSLLHWLAGLGAAGGTAMLLGLQRIRRPL